MINTKKYIFGVMIFIFVILLFCGRLTSSFVEIKSFHQIDFDAIKPNTLVIFDVDQTLIEPADNYVINEHNYEVRKWWHEFFMQLHKCTNQEGDILYGIMLSEAQRPLIEPFIVDEINLLKNRGVFVIACTAMSTGRLAIFDRLEQWRYEQLKKLGFEGSFNNQDFLLKSFDTNPVFYKGILAVDGEEKGKVIGAFLDAMHINPDTIIMFDDYEEYLTTVKEECEKRKIPFVGYLYLGGGYTVAWDKELTEFQANYLIEHHHWISDVQARDLMKQKDIVADSFE